jgi:hypothetical protein
MEDEKGRIEDHNERSDKEEVFTKVVRAGKRTYFFDVKSTRHEDLYLTITESKKRPGKEGKMFYEKHKIFLYKEDFEKFTEGLREAVAFAGNGVTAHASGADSREAEEPEEVDTTVAASEFSDVDFDELGTR